MNWLTLSTILTSIKKIQKCITASGISQHHFNHTINLTRSLNRFYLMESEGHRSSKTMHHAKNIYKNNICSILFVPEINGQCKKEIALLILEQVVFISKEFRTTICFSTLTLSARFRNGQMGFKEDPIF